MAARALILCLQFSAIFASFFKQHPITDEGNCAESAILVASINFLFFEDQHSVTLIDSSDYSVANAFACYQGNSFRPVDIYDDMKHFKLNTGDHRGSLFTFTLTEGVLLKAADEEVLEFLKPISIHNPRSKVLVLMFETAVSDAKKLLQKAFYDLKMLRVACVILKAQFIDGKYSKTWIELVLMNPFVESVPTFKNFNITPDNLVLQMEKVKQFTKKRVSNLQGYPLRISIYDYPMTSKPHFDKNGKITHYSGLEGELVSTIAKIMNFTPIYLEANGGRYGFQLPNGTYVGDLARIEYGLADISGNAKLIADYKTKNLAFLKPLQLSKQYFIIRRRETHKLVLIAIFSQYDFITKVISTVIYVSLPVVCVTFCRLESRLINSGKKVKSIGNTAIFAIAMLFNVSTKLPKGPTARIITGTILFYILIQSTLLQSTIYKNLNSKQEFGKIESIEELAEEGFLVKMPAGVALVFREPGENKVSWLMNRTGQSYTDVAIRSLRIEEILPKDQKVAFLWDSMFTTDYLDQFYDNTTGENLFERVPEIAYLFNIAMMAPNYSPFIESINTAITRYVESFVWLHLVTMAISENDKYRIHRIRQGLVPKTSQRSISWNDIKSVFQIYLLFTAVAAVAFVAELLIFRRKKITGRRVTFTL